MKTLPPELLESRIAPARFFLDVAGVLSIEGGVLPDYVDGTADKAASGADAAFHFHKGDVLIASGLGGEPRQILLKVEQGMAEAFFVKDAGMPPMLTGLAVSDGFSGVAYLQGSVATLLDEEGHFTPAVWQHASIARLVLTTDAGGDLFAGGDIGNVRVVLAATDPGQNVSLDEFAAGSAVGEHVVSLDGGGTLIDPLWTDSAAGADGGSIKDVRLPHGAAAIESGDGFSNETGRGGNGGDIFGIKIGVQHVALSIQTGGGAEGEKGGGRGGDIRGLKVEQSENDFTLRTGDGAAGGQDSGSRGGAGGGVTDIAIFGGSRSQVLQNLEIITGLGGDGSYKEDTLLNGKIRRTFGGGGDGGDIRKVRVNVDGGFGGIQMLAGDGGIGFFNAHGGAGGSIAGLTLNGYSGPDQPFPEVGIIRAVAGGGGSVEAGATDDAIAKGAGGRGGVISGMMSGRDVAVDVADFQGGAGGAGWGGGDGGGVQFSLLKDVGRFSITTGKGGDSLGTKAAGDGGGIFGVFAIDVGGVDFSTGAGGSAIGVGAFGGEGGDMVNLRIGQLQNNGGSAASFNFTTGNGGDAGETISEKARARAGGGGDMRDFILKIKRGGALVALLGGNGGNPADSDGREGAGGALAAIHVLAPRGDITATGGDAGSSGGIAARGGGIGVSDFVGGSDSVQVSGGHNSDGSVVPVGPLVRVNGELLLSV